MDEWMNNMYRDTTERWLVLERKEILMKVTTWIHLEDIMLSGIR
jgi:hypothetical protein